MEEEYDYIEAAKEEDAVEAFREGKYAKTNQNPHQPGTAEYRYWRQGFKTQRDIK
jgi:hypothetical protein